MQDTPLSGAVSPTDNRPPSATSHEESNQASRIVWSRDEYLFIQLQAEFTLAAASLPVPTALPAVDSIYYENFCQFFKDLQQASQEASSEYTTAIAQKSQDEYVLKQGELEPAVLLKARNLMRKAIEAEDFKRGKRWTVTPEVFDEYRKIREVIGFDTVVADPKDYPEMWSFLDRIVREKFPESCVPTVTDARTDKNLPDFEGAAGDNAPNSSAGSDTSSDGSDGTNGAAPPPANVPVMATTEPGATTVAEPAHVPDDDIESPQARDEQEGEQEDEENEEGDEAEDDSEDDNERPPTKRAKQTPKRKAPKSTKDGSKTRADNDTWQGEERDIVAGINSNYIEEHGLVAWHENFRTVLDMCVNAINAYRDQHKSNFRGHRRIDAVRSQLTKKLAYSRWKATAIALQDRIRNGKKIDDAELKPKNTFTRADIEPPKKDPKKKSKK